MISLFILFGIEHILAMTITVAVIALATLRLQKYNENSLWRTFNTWLAVIFLLEAIGSKIPVILRNEFLIFEDLPPWPWYLLLFELFIYGVFRLAYYPFLQYPDTKKEKILI